MKRSEVAEGTAEFGVALCGSGIGISIAVNRNPGVRCALVSEPLSAALAREHNDANVIAMGARLTGVDMAKACLDAFLSTEFAGGRHQRRVDKLAALAPPEGSAGCLGRPGATRLAPEQTQSLRLERGFRA